MRSVVLDGLCVKVLLVVLVEENLCNNYFWRDVPAVLIWRVGITVCCIALWKTRRIAETSRIEEWMRVVNAGVDVTNLDARTCHGSPSSSDPRWVGIDNEMALAQVGMVERVILNALHHRCGRDRRQRRSVELHSNGVQ